MCVHVRAAGSERVVAAVGDVQSRPARACAHHVAQSLVARVWRKDAREVRTHPTEWTPSRATSHAIAPSASLPPSLCLLACCTLASVGGSTCQLVFVRLIVCLFVCARYIWLHDSLKDVVVTPYLTERTDAYFVLSKKVRPSLASCQQPD